MYDMGHAVMAWTLTTVVACKYGGHTDDIPVLLRRALAAPPLWILFLALALNVGDVPLSRDLIHYCLVTGQVLVLLVPLAMGLLVSAAGMRRPEVIVSVALRSGFGGLVGFTLALLFGLTGTAAGVAALGACGSHRVHGRGAVGTRRTGPRAHCERSRHLRVPGLVVDSAGGGALLAAQPQRTLPALLASTMFESTAVSTTSGRCEQKPMPT